MSTKDERSEIGNFVQQVGEPLNYDDVHRDPQVRAALVSYWQNPSDVPACAVIHAVLNEPHVKAFFAQRAASPLPAVATTEPDAWRKRAEEAEAALLDHGLQPYTLEEMTRRPTEQEAETLAAFRLEMQENVIPRIVANIRANAQRVAEARHRPLYAAAAPEAPAREDAK